MTSVELSLTLLRALLGPGQDLNGQPAQDSTWASCSVEIVPVQAQAQHGCFPLWMGTLPSAGRMPPSTLSYLYCW